MVFKLVTGCNSQSLPRANQSMQDTKISLTKWRRTRQKNTCQKSLEKNIFAGGVFERDPEYNSWVVFISAFLNLVILVKRILIKKT